MARLKRGTLIASTLMLVAVIVSGCGLPYSTPPAATNTPPKAGFFASPMAGTPGANGMSDVSRFMTETAKGKIPPNIPQDGMVAAAIQHGGQIVDM